MNEILIAAFFGLIGGSIRAVIGLVKHYKSKKKFNPIYLLSTLLISAVIGSVTSTAVTTNHLMNLAVGYAGIDFIEGIVKIIKTKN